MHHVRRMGHQCKNPWNSKEYAKEHGIPVHGAAFPCRLAEFFIKFMTEPQDLVVDPFGGSFTTAVEAERLGRRWISTEQMVEYVVGAASRFYKSDGFFQNVMQDGMMTTA